MDKNAKGPGKPAAPAGKPKQMWSASGGKMESSTQPVKPGAVKKPMEAKKQQQPGKPEKK